MSQENLKSLLRKRAIAKGKLAVFKNFLQPLIDTAAQGAPTFKFAQPLSEVDVLQLEIRLNTFENLLTNYDTIHMEIVEVDSETNLQGHCDDYNDFENDYFEVLAKAKSLLHNQSTSGDDSDSRHSMPILSPHLNIATTAQTQPNHPNFVQTNRTIPMLHQHNEPRSSLVKLPTLQMKTFNGDPEQFLSFFEAFKSLVHNNESFDDVTRLLYLKSVLGTEPSKIIESLDIIPANYSVALTLLEKRYKNTKFLIHSHIKGIVEFPKIAKESATSIRHLADSTQAHLRALESLGESIDSCASFIQYLIIDKLDYNTKKEWEIEIAKIDSTPPTSLLIEFIEKRARLLEKIDEPQKSTNYASSPHSKQKTYKSRDNTTYTHISSKHSQREDSCPVCKGDHKIVSCQSFLDMQIAARLAKAKSLNLCTNCLRSGHYVANCKSGGCRKCGKKHFTLLHISGHQSTSQAHDTAQAEPVASDSQTSTTNLTSMISTHHSVEILPTAVIFIQDAYGKRHKCVALLDSASMRSYMTTSLCSQLKLSTTRVSIAVSGISQSKAKVSEIVTTKIESVCENFDAAISFLVLQKITGELPPITRMKYELPIPDEIHLANPNYQEKTKVDVLLGIDIFWQILSQAQPLSSKYPYLRNTKLGYVVSGQFPTDQLPTSSFCHLTTLDLSRQLAKFWELENVATTKPPSPEEAECESHFVKTYRRDDSGRFIVSIPLNSCPSILGSSKQHALKLFLSLEKRLQSNTKLKEMYIDFMEEYKNLGHMIKVTNPDAAKHQYFIPHHAVYKEQSITTKLRVVFNSSCPTSNGISFNDIQLNGPVLQDDLFSILLRFRRFKYVLTSDCAKMYRSVLIKEDQRPLQRIFWRSDPELPLDIYELTTVTYGEKASSFLAIRCLFEIAIQFEEKYPQISKIIKRDMYCDDLLTSCETQEEAKYICKNISTILQSAGFLLRKWNSNHPSVLDSTCLTELPNSILEFGPTNNTKTLGLLFNSFSDEFFFEIVNFQDVHKIVNKRSILSYISMLFDPLGLLNPCTVTARIFMQKIWLSNFNWDSTLSSDLIFEWNNFSQHLLLLNNLRIPRQAICSFAKTIELHAFSDGSKSAYGTCIYIRSVDYCDNISTQLLCSKTRVAPLKTLTIPKLELCGALIMAQLVDKVKNSLDLPIESITYWTDSTITLSWLKSQPHMLETFVANRVSQIQTLSDISRWKHVISSLNPADLVTRGILPQTLMDCDLWWKGPYHLLDPSLSLESEDHSMPLDNSPIESISVPSVATSFKSFINFERFSNVNKLKRTLAYVLRFIKNCRSTKESRTFHTLTFSEIQNSTIQLARLSQMESYSKEVTALSNGKPLPKKSVLIKLNPFFDSTDRILRVGGRLSNSSFPLDKKYPILISARHAFSKLLFHSEHERLCHAGPTHLLSSIREQFWPVGGRNLAKKISFECVTCFRCRPRNIDNLLGNLPFDRITPQPPFSVTGTDYCGPFVIKNKIGRGWKPVKCYVCLFICFTTKAIHLEPVTDLSTESFILTLRRFASRRGLPRKIYSDNARNYCGAKSLLKDLGEFLIANKDQLTTLALNESVTWKFLPPYSPSLGGLWEAGIKSTKFHLKRVVGNSTLSFEHFLTVITQIEGILNSRPLHPLSSHPNDFLPLTPSHFLIGRPITTVPDPDLSEIQENRLTLFQRIQQIVQNFWTRWSKEYISELQVRTRWQETKPNVKEDTMVLIKDSNLPPTKWKLGRVIKAVSGKDGVVRVVLLRTENGETSRAVSKICPLPISN